MIKFKIKFEVKFEIILVKLKLKSNVIEFRKLLMGKPLVWLQQSTHAVPLLATIQQMYQFQAHPLMLSQKLHQLR